MSRDQSTLDAPRPCNTAQAQVRRDEELLNGSQRVNTSLAEMSREEQSLTRAPIDEKFPETRCADRRHPEMTRSRSKQNVSRSRKTGRAEMYRDELRLDGPRRADT